MYNFTGNVLGGSIRLALSLLWCDRYNFKLGNNIEVLCLCKSNKLRLSGLRRAGIEQYKDIGNLWKLSVENLCFFLHGAQVWIFFLKILSLNSFFCFKKGAYGHWQEGIRLIDFSVSEIYLNYCSVLLDFGPLCPPPSPVAHVTIRLE